MLTIYESREVIQILKRDYGFTYNQIAEIIGVSANHLYHVVSGDRNLKRDKILKQFKL